MALSNWDTLAIDKNGKSTDGRFMSPLGVVVEIYKNWLYVEDKKAWQKGGRYVEPIVMKVEESAELAYKDVGIYSTNGPQEGICCLVYTTYYRKDKEGKMQSVLHDSMIGTGVYGFDRDLWIGVTKETIKFLKDWLRRELDGLDWDLGFKPSELLEKAELRRSNQGDRYFAKHIGVDPQATAPEEAKEPHVFKLTEAALKGRS